MIELVPPWPDGLSINARSPYGPRRHPITGKVKFHHGVDVAMPIGTPLTAAADGTIAHKGAGASGGYTLLIRHEGNWHTVYYHLAQPSHLHLGQKVTVGDVVAKSGNTGASTGPHLHFELRRSRRFGDTVDPVPHFRTRHQPARPTPIPENPSSVASRRFLSAERAESGMPIRPSRLGRVSSGLGTLNGSWLARGAHALRSRMGR